MNFEKLYEWIDDDEIKAKEAFILLKSYHAMQEIDLALHYLTTFCRVSIGIEKLTILQGNHFFVSPKLLVTRSNPSSVDSSQIIVQTKLFHLRYLNQETIHFIPKPTKKFLEIKDSSGDIIFFQSHTNQESIFLKKGTYFIKNPSKCVLLEIC